MLDYFGISLEESMAFGDGGNDVLMLKHVGIGVAMGNAGDEVKLAADYTAFRGDLAVGEFIVEIFESPNL